MSESELRSLGYIDSTGNLTAAHDAATAHLGAPWRMPTPAEFYVLFYYCDAQWVNRNGVNGRLVTGRGTYASNSIFFPAAGMGSGVKLLYAGSDGNYWSSAPDLEYLFASFFGFRSTGSASSRWAGNRFTGMSVRAVRNSDQEVCRVSSTASTHFALDNRTGVRLAEAAEQIRFSPAWATDTAGAMVIVSTNGIAVKSATEADIFEWTPTQTGACQFTHVVYVNGEQIGETLTATFVVSGMSPISADWSVGSITLKATGVSVEEGELAWLSYCDANVENGSWERIDNFTPTADDAEKSICVTDTGFSSRLGGIPPVKYRLQIGKNSDDARITLYCTTRTKRGVFVGVGEFGDDYGTNKPKRLSSASDDAEKFSDLMKNQGRMKTDDCHLLTDSGATYENVDGAFSDIASVVKPGDVCVVYFSTHGGVVGDTTIGSLCLYDKPPVSDDPNRIGYHEALLAKHIRMLDPENKGVAVVNIISACHSGAFFDDSNEEICTPVSSWCHRENLSPVNVAWLTAANSKTKAYSYFVKFLLHYGWVGGWADEDDDGVVSFVELANYTKRQYDELFSGIVFADETESKQVQISNGALLGKILPDRVRPIRWKVRQQCH